MRTFSQYIVEDDNYVPKYSKPEILGPVWRWEYYYNKFPKETDDDLKKVFGRSYKEMMALKKGSWYHNKGIVVDTSDFPSDTNWAYTNKIIMPINPSPKIPAALFRVTRNGYIEFVRIGAAWKTGSLTMYLYKSGRKVSEVKAWPKNDFYSMLKLENIKIVEAEKIAGKCFLDFCKRNAEGNISGEPPSVASAFENFMKNYK